MNDFLKPRQIKTAAGVTRGDVDFVAVPLNHIHNQKIIQKSGTSGCLEKTVMALFVMSRDGFDFSNAQAKLFRVYRVGSTNTKHLQSGAPPRRAWTSYVPQDAAELNLFPRSFASAFEKAMVLGTGYNIGKSNYDISKHLDLSNIFFDEI